MGMFKRKQPKYNGPQDNRTKQSFKDQCDVNKIIKKHQITTAASHAMLFPPEAYADFEGQDLLSAYQLIGRANEIFDALPSEVRNEFNNDALRFAAYASKPENVNRLGELIPAIAAPGAFFPNPVQRDGGGAGAATPPPEPAPAADPAPAEASPQAGVSAPEQI